MTKHNGVTWLEFHQGNRRVMSYGHDLVVEVGSIRSSRPDNGMQLGNLCKAVSLWNGIGFHVGIVTWKVDRASKKELKRRRFMPGSQPLIDRELGSRKEGGPVAPIRRDQLHKGRLSKLDMGLSSTIGSRVIGGNKSMVKARNSFDISHGFVDELRAVVRLYNLGKAKIAYDPVEGTGGSSRCPVNQGAEKGEPGGNVGDHQNITEARFIGGEWTKQVQGNVFKGKSGRDGFQRMKTMLGNVETKTGIARTGSSKAISLKGRPEETFVPYLVEEIGSTFMASEVEARE
ncbi:hypothetical protein QOT17_25649 [Balamuthia mandrillaris]